jgi:hypothetical protein
MCRLASNQASIEFRSRQLLMQISGGASHRFLLNKVILESFGRHSTAILLQYYLDCHRLLYNLNFDAFGLELSWERLARYSA